MSESRAGRLRQALELRDRRKLYALAMEIGVNASSVTRWLQGDPIRMDHAERLCQVLNISMDWLMLGRGSIDPLPPRDLSVIERRLLNLVRACPPDVVAIIITLLARIAEL
ncbi:MAG TPA: helix-turn-helix transcriptional regulator [Stellaceae bacterium]|nr:helix-turn-helix transcriptional regulator [Stellaceae bacterium]